MKGSKKKLNQSNNLHSTDSKPYYLATKSDPRRCAEDTGDGEGGGEGGGGGDGGGGDPVEEEPALLALGRLHLCCPPGLPGLGRI